MAVRNPLLSRRLVNQELEKNTNIKVIALIACMCFGMVGCATPHVVDTRQLGDKNLSCSNIKDQIDEADRFEYEARSERKITVKNVAAAVLFWPALLGTYVNTEDAIDAAKERKHYLRNLYEKNSCSTPKRTSHA